METAIVRKYRVIPNPVFMPPGIPGVFRALECLLWCPVSPRPIDSASWLCLVKNRLSGGERGRGCPSRSPGRWPVQLSR